MPLYPILASAPEGFEGAIGLRGPFGSVCMNKREPDMSLPSQPPPPTLSVVPGEEGAIALRITFGDHRRRQKIADGAIGGKLCPERRWN